MQVFKVNDLNFKKSLTSKILDDLNDYFSQEMKSDILTNLEKNSYFAVKDNYGFEGFVSLNDRQESFEINGIGVLKSAFRNRCGCSLIKACIDFARINNKKLITINIKDDSSNDINYLKTRRFFTKMGFCNLTVINSNEFLNPCLVMAYIL